MKCKYKNFLCMDLPRSLALSGTEWKDQVRHLQTEVKKCAHESERNNFIIHFFHCAMQAEFVTEFQSFRDIAERVIRSATEVEIFDPRASASRAVQNVLRTEAFPADMLSRITVEDVRNAMVSDLWRCHAVVVRADMDTRVPQGIPNHVRAQLGTATGDADDAIRLINILKWLNIAHRVVAVRGVLDGTRTLTDTMLDTCAGYWWKSFTAKGTCRTVWEHVLDIAQYSMQSQDDETL